MYIVTILLPLLWPTVRMSRGVAYDMSFFVVSLIVTNVLRLNGTS